MTTGRRRCALKLAVGLHVLAWVVLVGGCVTPFWARVEDAKTGETLLYRGLLTSCPGTTSLGKNCTVNDFNQFSDVTTNEASLYGMLAVIFGLVAIATEFFVVQTYCLAACNNSCGKQYSPDWLLFFSLLTGFIVVTCLVMFELQLGRSLSDATLIKMDYSRGFVIGAAALVFMATFVTVCDRKPENRKK